MKKIMFNDRYGLTQAVLDGRKTMTRRLCNFNAPDEEVAKIQAHNAEYLITQARYKVGEIVAVAQSYCTILEDLEIPANYYCMEHWEQDTQKRADYVGRINEPGWENKMFVRSEACKHHIKITNIRVERLQDITEEDCMKEGIIYIKEVGKYYFERSDRDKGFYFITPREAFAGLIDKINGRGTWDSNPWVWIYEFELIK